MSLYEFDRKRHMAYFLVFKECKPMDIISKEDAKSHGLKHYFTGVPCCRGHLSPRTTRSGHCVECRREDNHRPEATEARKRYAQTERGKERVRAGGIKFRKTEKHAVYQAEWREKNADKVRATARRYRSRNIEKCLERDRVYAAENKEKRRAQLREWQTKNKEKCVAYSLKRDAAVRQSAVYIDRERAAIELLYDISRDLGLHVDHIIPQNHRDVTGLHCLLNLRLLGPTKNMSKGNKFDPSRAHMCEPF